MENQNTNPSPALQENTPSRTADLLKEYFKSSSSTKTAYNFLKVLAILFVASFLWSSIAESSLQFTFPIVALLYMVFVFGQIIIKENDGRIKKSDILAKTLTAVTVSYNVLKEELENYKEAHIKNKQVLTEWEQANSYLKVENSNLNENFSKLRDSYDAVSGRLSSAEKLVVKYKSEQEGFDNIIKKEKTDAYVLAIQEYDEYTTLNRAIPQLKDEDKKRFAEARQKELEARINKAKARSEQG
ncbi:hypothetical protein WAF17_16505 [Bernardetia sp. ABR2-2B]|uniref:hypothetical protein n=1 Tax=Bernardetia sp. ABR2-2B TaxID=3127472 RepID=UPI0030D3D86C